MKFRLLVHWPSDDILPITEDFASAQAAARRYRELERAGMASITIFSMADGTTLRVSPTRLAVLSRSEQRAGNGLPRRARAAIASALLGMLASALPNAFGDFGVLATADSLRAARTTRSGARRP